MNEIKEGSIITYNASVDKNAPTMRKGIAITEVNDDDSGLKNHILVAADMHGQIERPLVLIPASVVTNVEDGAAS